MRDKMMARVTKRVEDNEVNPRGIEHPTLFADHSLYEVSFPHVRTEELTVKVIYENMLFQVYFEGHHYQVPKDISDHLTYGSVLKRINVFIRSSSGNLNAKKTIRC